MAIASNTHKKDGEGSKHRTSPFIDLGQFIVRPDAHARDEEQLKYDNCSARMPMR